MEQIRGEVGIPEIYQHKVTLAKCFEKCAFNIHFKVGIHENNFSALGSFKIPEKTCSRYRNV